MTRNTLGFIRLVECRTQSVRLERLWVKCQSRSCSASMQKGMLSLRKLIKKRSGFILMQEKNYRCHDHTLLWIFYVIKFKVCDTTKCKDSNLDSPKLNKDVIVRQIQRQMTLRGSQIILIMVYFYIPHHHAFYMVMPMNKIGRASCRERV